MLRTGSRILVVLSLMLPMLIIEAKAEPPVDLLFSQYIEGSSYNKAVEIYNGTDLDIDLADYTLLAYHNGASEPTYTMQLEGIIASGDVALFCHTDADQAIVDIADATFSALSFNGDDALVLINSTDEVIDSIGQVGVDPGSSWGTSPTSTKDNTLVRLPSICSGDTISDDPFDPALEWQGYPQDDFNGLGSHTAECSAGTEYTLISEIQTPVSETDDSSQLLGETVLTQGLVTEVYSNGFIIQGTEAPEFNGIVVFTDTGFTMPARGDLVEVEGIVAEYYSLTELTEPIVTILSSGNPLPAPTLLPTQEVNNEQWEGVLVKVEQVEIIDADLGYGEWSVDDGSGIVRIDDKGDYSYTPSSAQLLEYIIGVVDYSYGNFKIQPRSDEDISIQAPPPELVFIHEVQGNSSASPYAGTTVTIEGVVVADFQGNGELQGFFIQEEDADVDENPETSEGIFVYNSSYDVSMGDMVQLTGEVTEYYNLTEIKNLTDLIVLDHGVALPTAAMVSLPFADSDYMERYEGMLTTFSQALTVSENYNLGRYGELVLSNGRLWNPTNVVSPGEDALLLQAANDLNRIIVDDGSTTQNPDPIIFPAPGLSADNTVRGGDTVQDLTGVISYSYGDYRVHPTLEPVFSATNPRSESPVDVGGPLKVASFNVLNYFTTIDGPDCPYEAGCRGADSEEEFTRQRAKIISAMLAIDADIFGLMELENDPLDSPLHDLVQGLNERLGEALYEPIYTGALGTDAIKVGFIYKSSSVSPIGNFAVLDSSVDSTFNDEKNRPTLAQTFFEKKSQEKLTIAVNHLKSKGSDCDELDDPDVGDGQGNCNLTRTAAAQALANWLTTDPTGSNDEDFLIIGDLNAYAKEDPVTALQAAGYTNLIDVYTPEGAYSYVYYGQAGYLDHALANPTLTEQVTGVTEYHSNCDEPKVLDYNTEYKSTGQLESLYSENAFRGSDHDPVIVGLNLQPQGTATFCSYLGDNRHPRLPDTDTFFFKGEEGEEISITVKQKEGGESEGKNARLGLKDGIKGVHLHLSQKEPLPSTITALIPANGKYIAEISELFSFKQPQPFIGDYCLSIHADTGRPMELYPSKKTE